MVEVLSTSADPKHRNSEFLKFLNQLNEGALTIDDNQQLVEDKAKMAEFEKQEEERVKADKKRQLEDEQFKL
jgi:hypothetical protein